MRLVSLPPFTGEVPTPDLFRGRRWGLLRVIVRRLRFQKARRIFRRLQYLFQNAVHIVIDLIVPEPQNNPALFLHKFITRGVTFKRVGKPMLFAIAFDDKPCLNTGEVGDIRTDRVLTAKTKAAEPSVAETRPQTPFRFGHRLTQRACVSVGSADWHG